MAFALLLTSALAVQTAQVSALDGTPEAQDGIPEAQESFPVNIRFLNAMTSMSKIDVYINGDQKEQRVDEGLDYGTVSDPYTGTAPVSAVVIKQNVNLGLDRTLFNTIIPNEAGKEYVVIVSDFLIIPIEMDLSATKTGSARALSMPPVRRLQLMRTSR